MTIRPLVLLLPGLLGCSPPPNIVFIYIDDLGWRDVGAMGSTFYDTPNVDRLAAEGMRFTSAYANAPNCAPSRASLLTGLYAPRHGVYTVNSAARGDTRNRRLVPVENRTDLDTAFVTIAEVLREAGYATGHVGKWHLGGVGSMPTDHGFTWAVAGNELGSPPSYFYPYVRRDGTTIPGLDEGSRGEYLTDRLTDEALRFLDEHRDQRFFLYLSHYAVHTPLRAKPDYVDAYREKPPSDGQGHAVYAAMVRSMDEGIGRVLERLDSLGLSDNTLVIFYSDNGGYGPATSMAPLRGSKGMLYEGGIREPLIVRWPGTVQPGSVTDVPVIGTDFFPTLVSIAGAGLPANTALDGVDIGSVLRGGDLDPRPLFWHFPAYLQADRSVDGPWRTTPASAIRMGDHKLIVFFEDNRAELYDLAADIGESIDLSAKMPAKTAEFRALLQDWWAVTGAFIPTEVNPGYQPVDVDTGR